MRDAPRLFQRIARMLARLSRRLGLASRPAVDAAPGWNAIDAALARFYGTTEPLHYAPAHHPRLGGRDPIDGISAYRVAEPRPHWHFVTYGFSELYDKEGHDAAVSGYGFELTLRVAADGDAPPPWAIGFLQNLGRYVFSTGATFEIGHYMNLNGPIVAGSSSAIRAILFVADAVLPARIDTPHGVVRFLQIVGITLDELEAIKRWDARAFASLLWDEEPGLLTDVHRQSILSKHEIARRVETGIANAGSSTAVLFASGAAWEERGQAEVLVTLGAKEGHDLAAILPGRIPHGRELTLLAGESAIHFRPGDGDRWSIAGEGILTIDLTAATARQLAMVLVSGGGDDVSADALPGLVFRAGATTRTPRPPS